MPDDGGYLLGNLEPDAPSRLQALSSLFDAWTFAHLDRLGIGEGWRCWEVGAGSASVPGFLAARAGASGYVLATDLEPTMLPGGAGFEVRRHELGRDPVPEGGFDLVHARLVLVHVAERDRALADLVSSLRPGGLLLVEEADPALQPLVCPDERGDEERLANRLKDGFRQLMAARGVDLAFGRTLPRRLRAAGLEDVESDAYFPITSPACRVLELATVAQIRGRLVSAGLATAEEIDRHLDHVREGRLDLATSPLVSAWGRRGGRA